jgi:two-component system, NtrC family, response regulator AtoC
MILRRDGARLLRRLFPTRNAAVRDLLRVAAKVADRDASVLILGESGAGKDHLAEAIHLAGARHQEPFVTIDCSSFPGDLFESELFGYERGAFTGALSRKPGRLELANRGTAYFDEVAAIPSPLQAKLLRVLQEKAFTRLGGSKPLRLDVRVIASSNLVLDELLESGAFRRDLFYRLNVVSLNVPPLRARPEDIELLATGFLTAAAARLGKELDGFEPEALELLTMHAWPGNVRELRNVVDRAAILESGRLVTPSSLPLAGFVAGADFVSAAAAGGWSLAELEGRYIREVLRKSGGNYSRAAAILGINRKTLLEKRRRYGIE